MGVKKKISIPLLIVGTFLSAAIGYYVNGAWHTGMEFSEFMQAIELELSYPFRDYYNETTIKAVLIAVFIFALLMLIYYTGRKNLMPGREFGTARFGSPKLLTKVLKGDTKTGDKGNHRILSQNVRMNIDNRLTKFNNNILVIGGSGAKKTFGFVKPNILQMNTSFIITDPKGEILRSEGELLKQNGYNVRVLNLMDMDSSDGYNPFDYIRDENDIPILIGNLIGNTTPKNAMQNDPFWEKSEGMFLQALFYYVWYEEGPKTRNIRTVLKLLREAEVAKDEPSELDKRMWRLGQTSPLGEDHPAIVMYRKCMRGAGDTVRSIIISANARLAKLENEHVLRMMDHDDMHFEELGIGENGDEQTKTALFCLISDSDKTYNFIVGMLYTQAFQRLYKIADEEYGGELPIHVTFMLDEFANVALPDDFCSLISTMRSRSISSVIIIQNLAQLKALFKDTWETITGNCDTTVYLGGNEQSTHEYISKLLGKGTIDKRSSGETRGRQGSSSRNYDALGRELMTPDEVGRLNRNKCIVNVAGQYPVLDDKYDTPKHPMFRISADGTGKPFVKEKRDDTTYGKPFEILGEKALAYYEKKKNDKKNHIYIDTVTYDEFMMLDDLSFSERLTDLQDKAEVERINESEGLSSSLQYMPTGEADADAGENTVSGLIRSAKQKRYEHLAGTQSKAVLIKPKNPPADSEGEAPETIRARLDLMSFTESQRREIERAITENIPENYILTYAYPTNSTVKMATCRKNYKTGLIQSA